MKETLLLALSLAVHTLNHQDLKVNSEENVSKTDVV
jgi:hypothetical protein